MANVDSYCVVCADGFFVPDLLINFINRKYFSGIFDQKKKDIVFNGSELDQIIIR